jgi:signal transduction histidine kinase
MKGNTVTVEQSGLRVLVVEDDLDTQANLRDILEIDGYRVELAATVKEALSERDWSSLFAIILDRRLPDGTADVLLPQMRQLAPKAAVIVVTGFADLDGAIAVLRHGIADFIPKPVNADMLRASLARVAHLREVEQRSHQAERLAVIGEMMASVAHESRNALQRIQISVEMLQMKLASDSEGIEELSKIEKAGDNLYSLLEELRGYAAPIQLERFQCNLADVWRNAWRNLGRVRTLGAVEFREELNGTQLTCHVDPERLEQVFRNLFDNALSACGDHGRIQVHCTEEQQNGAPIVSLVIRDTGPGLNEQQMAKVFEPFFTTKPKGTGLGMAIVRRIVEAHGGRIDVAESVGPGAAFRIRLPRGAEVSQQ